MPPNTAVRGSKCALTKACVQLLGEAQGRVTGVHTRKRRGKSPATWWLPVFGIVPAVAPLIAAGAAGSNGVDVDFLLFAPHWTTSTPSAIAPRTPILTPIMP